MMNIEEVRDYCLALPEVSEDLPYGPDCLVFRVVGKIFMHVDLQSHPVKIALKHTVGQGRRCATVMPRCAQLIT